MASNAFRGGNLCVAVITPIDPATCLPDVTVDSWVVPMCSDWEVSDVLTDDIDLTATGPAGDSCGPQMRILGQTKYQELTFRFAMTDWSLEGALRGNAVSIELNGTGDVIGIQRKIGKASGFCNPGAAGAVSILAIRGVGICGSSGFCAPVSTTGATNCVAELFPYVTNIRRSAGTYTKSDANEPEYTAEVYPYGVPAVNPMGLTMTVDADALHVEQFIDCDLVPSTTCEPVPYPFP